MKKISALFLSALLMVSSVPLESFAATTETTTKVSTSTDTIVVGEPVVTSADPSDEKLKSAILEVKKLITIPEEYTDFNYYYNSASDYSESYWSLTWTNPNTYACIQVNCDTDNHIKFYYKNDSSVKSTGIAKYSKAELKAAADEFIKKIAPEVAGSLAYVSADYDGIYSGNYVYYYQRKNNGVEFPDNDVSVSVNSITGEVSSIWINWLYDTKVPSSSVKLTKEEAAALIKKNMKMKLVYLTDYYKIYSDDSTSTKKAYLAYVPEKDYISIDAKTGEVYTERSQWIDTGATSTTADESITYGGSGKNDGSTLTDAEIAKVEELKNLISKSDAIKKVTSNQYLYLDENLTSYTATLQKNEDESGNSTYVWRISLSDPREVNYETDTDTYRAYAYATVDAKTGKILSFYADLKSNYDEVNQKWNTVKIAYDKEKGKEVLEKFLKTQIEDRFNKSVLTDTTDDYVAYYNKKDPVYGGYNYNYTRVNEGIEFDYNNINGSVDGVTGKIYSYGSDWDDNIVFESTKGVISADDAMNYYLGNEGFGLKYEINTINKYDSSYENKTEYYDSSEAYSVEYEIRLVYRPDVSPMYISPFTGKQLNSDGEEYTETKAYTYQDIDHSDVYKNVWLLSDMNIGFDGVSFLPKQKITIGEVNTLLSTIGYYSSSDENDSGSTVTREKLAQIFINKLGLEKMSKLQDIYSTGFTDEYNIDKQYVGAVALAKGLGIMGADTGNYFNPKSEVTRLEAVNMIMNFVDVQQNNVFY